MNSRSPYAPDHESAGCWLRLPANRPKLRPFEEVPMARSLALVSLLLSLAGCGVAETGATVATVGASKAEEARQGLQTEARVQERVNAAMNQAADQRNSAESASQ